MPMTQYIAKITGDTSGLEKALKEAYGSLKKLNDDEVLIKLNYDGNVKGFNAEFDKILKSCPELNIQFQYDVNRKMLEQELDKLNNLTDLKIDIDKGNVDKKVQSMIASLDKSIANMDSDDIVEKKIKDIYRYANTVQKLGAKLGVNIDSEVYKSVEGMGKNIESIFENITVKHNPDKLLLFNISGTIDKEISKTEERINDFKDALSSMEKQGASSSKTSSEFDRLQDEIKILKSDISDMQKDLDGLSGEAFTKMTQDIQTMNKQLEITQTQIKEISKLQIDPNNISFHVGDLGDNKTRWKSEGFHRMIMDMNLGGFDEGDSGYGIIGTGVYHTQNVDDLYMSERNPRGYALNIDPSKYKLLEATTDEAADKLLNFLGLLQGFSIAQGSGYKGWDERLENINVDKLYSLYQEVFNKTVMDITEFQNFIDDMIRQVADASSEGLSIGAGSGDFVSQKYNHVDNIATQFLKKLGYEGVSLKGTSVDSYEHGNTIFDLKPTDIIETFDTYEDMEKYWEQNKKSMEGFNKSSVSDIQNIGKEMDKIKESVKEFARQISEAFDEIKNLHDEINKLTSATTEGLRKGLDTHLDSEEAKQSDKDFINGLTRSIEEKTPEAVSAAEALGKAVTNALNDSLTLDELRQKIAVEIPEAIGIKNDAFIAEEGIVKGVVDNEINKFKELKNEIGGVSNTVQETSKSSGNISNMLNENNLPVTSGSLGGTHFQTVAEEIYEESKTAGKQAGDATIEGLRDGVDAHSDSRKSIAVADDVINGFNHEIEARAGEVRDTTRKAGQSAIEGFKEGLKSSNQLPAVIPLVDTQAQAAAAFYKDIKSNSNLFTDGNAGANAEMIAYESKEFAQLSDNANEAANAKDKFATANGVVLASIMKSLSGLNSEGDGFKYINTIINKLVNDKKSEKLIKNLETIRNLLTTNISDSSLLNALSNMASQGDNLKDLAAVLKASASQVEKAKAALSSSTSSTNNIDEAIALYKQLYKAQKEQANIKQDTNIVKYNELTDIIEKLKQKIKELNLTEEQANKVSAATAMERIAAYNAVTEAERKAGEEKEKNIQRAESERQTALKEATALLNNGKLMSAYGDKVRETIQKLKDMNTSFDPTEAISQIKKLRGEINSIKTAAVEAGKSGKTLGQMLKSRLQSLVAYLGTFVQFYDIVRYTRQAISTIKDLDTQLVDLRKTTTMTTTELNEFYNASSDVAKQLGVTTSEIISQASAWSRLGYSSKEAATEMAQLSSQFTSISPGMTTDNATDYLVSTMQAYGIAVDDVERKIMDNVNRIGNTFATTNAEIGEMLTRSSAAMKAANNSLEETIALEASAVEVTRNAEMTGTAFRTNYCPYVQQCA